jgi:hypothetical protein
MYMYMYICTYTYMHIPIYVRVCCVCLCTCVCVYIYIYIYRSTRKMLTPVEVVTTETLVITGWLNYAAVVCLFTLV